MVCSSKIEAEEMIRTDAVVKTDAQVRVTTNSKRSSNNLANKRRCTTRTLSLTIKTRTSVATTSNAA